MPLPPPDSHHLSAAIGWMELKNLEEALADLDRIKESRQRHPEVLEVRWTIYAAQQKWESCVDIAKIITMVAPEDPFGWVHLSFALHELKRTQEAYNNLLKVLPNFPEDWLMRYNMACYACQLGANEEAQRWLNEAKSQRGDQTAIQNMATTDPDLAPLFKKQQGE